MTIRARFAGHHPDHNAIHSLLHSSAQPIGRDHTARSLRVLTAARQTVGVQSGTLLATLRRESGSNATGPYHDVIGGRRGLTPYHGWHIFGTEPHTIRPRRRKALRFRVGGVVVFAARVDHPGTKANRYLQRALQAAR